MVSQKRDYLFHIHNIRSDVSKQMELFKELCWKRGGCERWNFFTSVTLDMTCQLAWKHKIWPTLFLLGKWMSEPSRRCSLCEYLKVWRFHSFPLCFIPVSSLRSQENCLLANLSPSLRTIFYSQVFWSFLDALIFFKKDVFWGDFSAFILKILLICSTGLEHKYLWICSYSEWTQARHRLSPVQGSASC